MKRGGLHSGTDRRMRGDYLMVKSALPTTSFDEARGEEKGCEYGETTLQDGAQCGSE